MISPATTFAIALILVLSAGLSPTVLAFPSYDTSNIAVRPDVADGNLPQFSRMTPGNIYIGFLVICAQYRGQGPTARLFAGETTGFFEYGIDFGRSGDCKSSIIRGSRGGGRPETNHRRLFNLPGLYDYYEWHYECPTGQLHVSREMPPTRDFGESTVKQVFACDPKSSANVVAFGFNL